MKLHLFLDGLVRVLILLIILNVTRLFCFIVTGKCMLLGLYSYLLWATISALYYALLLGEEAEASPSIANTLWRV